MGFRNRDEDAPPPLVWEPEPADRGSALRAAAREAVESAQRTVQTVVELVGSPLADEYRAPGEPPSSGLLLEALQSWYFALRVQAGYLEDAGMFETARASASLARELRAEFGGLGIEEDDE